MQKPRLLLAAAPLALIAATAASCGRLPPKVHIPAGMPIHELVACDEMKHNRLTDIPFAAPAEAQARIKSLLGEAYKLMQASVAVETELMEACRVVGRGAGAFEEELKGLPNGGHGAEKVCAIAAAKAQKILETAKAAKIEIWVDHDKPLCFTEIEPVKQCLNDCGTSVSGADDRASCIGGEVFGTCKGRCSAACINDPGACSGACYGVCTGKCDKEFRGMCGGKCNGTCNGNKTPGPHRCVGICDGSCSDKAEGVCAGRCDGACSGPWEPRDVGKCAGICAGTCAGTAGPPVCTGDYLPTGAEANCTASCESTAALVVRCDAPQIRITAKGGKQTAEVQKLLAGLQAGLPRIYRITEGTSRKLPRAIEGISAAAIEWSNAYATAGVKGLSCVRAGLDGMKAGLDGVEIAVKGADAWKPLLTPLVKPEAPQGPAPDE